MAWSAMAARMVPSSGTGAARLSPKSMRMSTTGSSGLQGFHRACQKA